MIAAQISIWVAMSFYSPFTIAPSLLILLFLKAHRYLMTIGYDRTLDQHPVGCKQRILLILGHRGQLVLQAKLSIHVP
ncbi:hypothetical protein D3C78_1155310 [compost metagenome]